MSIHTEERSSRAVSYIVENAPYDTLPMGSTHNTPLIAVICFVVEQMEALFSRFLSKEDWFSIATTCWKAFFGTEEIIKRKYNAQRLRMDYGR